MSKLHIELDVNDSVLPRELASEFMAMVGKHAVLDLLRQGRVTQSKAAELLDISRAELFDLMAAAEAPHIDLDVDELHREQAVLAEHLGQPFTQKAVKRLRSTGNGAATTLQHMRNRCVSRRIHYVLK